MRMSDKLPIPRLQREKREVVAKRVCRACEPCRARKSKCDGARPSCSLCRAQGLTTCFYPESKTVRQQEELGSLRKEIKTYRELLEDISHGLEGSIADRVTETLRVRMGPFWRVYAFVWPD